MKKLFFILATLLLVCSCTESISDSKSEAFVRQICHEKGILDSDIKSIKSSPSDSLLNPYMAGNNAAYIANNVLKFCKGEITSAECEKVLDEQFNLIQDIQNSWLSNKAEAKDDYILRKVEKVDIEYKSGKKETIRVLFDNTDTPVKTEKQVEELINDALEDYYKDYELYIDCF